MDDKGLLNAQLDRINGWINNCDQKAGIILAFMGAIATIIITSDIVYRAKESLFHPIWDFLLNNANYSFSLRKTIIILLLIIVSILFILTIYQFLQVLKPRTKDKAQNSNSENYIPSDKSLLYFDSICKRSYDEYCENLKTVAYDKELSSQIYINSHICSEKFLHYKNGINLLIWFLVALIVLLSFYLLFPNI
jgi:hypothetical protein